MYHVAMALVGLAAMAFALAVAANFQEVPYVQVTSEGLSRASANLALLAIAMVMCFRGTRVP